MFRKIDQKHLFVNTSRINTKDQYTLLLFSNQNNVIEDTGKTSNEYDKVGIVHKTLSNI